MAPEGSIQIEQTDVDVEVNIGYGQTVDPRSSSIGMSYSGARVGLSDSGREKVGGAAGQGGDIAAGMDMGMSGGGCDNPPCDNKISPTDFGPPPVYDFDSLDNIDLSEGEVEINKEVRKIDNKIDELSTEIKDAHKKYTVLEATDAFDRNWIERMDDAGSAGRAAGSAKQRQMYERDSVNKSKKRTSLQKIKEILLTPKK